MIAFYFKITYFLLTACSNIHRFVAYIILYGCKTCSFHFKGRTNTTDWGCLKRGHWDNIWTQDEVTGG